MSTFKVYVPPQSHFNGMSMAPPPLQTVEITADTASVEHGVLTLYSTGPGGRTQAIFNSWVYAEREKDDKP